MESYGSRYREVPERLVDEKVATSGSTATAAHGSAVKIHCSASMWRAIPAAADFHSPAMAKGSAMAVTWQCYEGQRQYHDSTHMAALSWKNQILCIIAAESSFRRR